MRRSVYYMGRSLTQRHLNACNSPLATGFVRPNAFSSTMHGLAASPLCGLGFIGGGGAVIGANGALVASSETALSQLLTSIIAQGKPVSALATVVCIQNISSCVCACVRVLLRLTLKMFSPFSTTRGDTTVTLYAPSLKRDGPQ
ncbi:hypothetical protein, conserved [Leishmania lindenbergi]|uniref:Uncharacterized protein n=1 Tax=Leishmania lindenbergi TaxID=651832 RepID=A0AAW3ADC4_9TRYP